MITGIILHFFLRLLRRFIHIFKNEICVNFIEILIFCISGVAVSWEFKNNATGSIG